MIRRLLMKSYRQGLLCVSGLLLLPACIEVPVDDEITTGVWMLDNGHHLHNDVTDACRPMLMAVDVYEDRVSLGRRAFPCDTDSVTLESLSLQRDGASLLLDEHEVGTLLGQSLEITLPNGAGSISWDMKRADAPYQESLLSLGTFSAKPKKVHDTTPLAIPASFSATEDLPFEGTVHAARLPDESIEYVPRTTPSRSTVDFFDSQTGRFRLIPNPNFSGKDEFSFLALGENKTSNWARVEITFASTPDPMEALPMAVTVDEDAQQMIEPIVSNPDLHAYSVQVAKPPVHGKVLTDKTFFKYQSDPDYNGPDSFTYVVVDGGTKSNEATIDITVSPVNDAPMAKDLEVQVTAGSATPVTLQVTDIDSTDFFFNIVSPPLHGTFFGDPPNLMYQPDEGFPQGEDSFTYDVWDLDGKNLSAPATVKLLITPGPYVCKGLASNLSSGVFPQWQDDSGIYYRASYFGNAPAIGVAGGFGFGSQVLQEAEFDTFGFDNSVGNAHRTTFFGLGSSVYFTTSTEAWAVRFYRATGLVNETLFDIPTPANGVTNEPSMGEAYLDANAAYLPMSWPTSNSQYTCQVWRVAPVPPAPELVHTFALANGPCFGMRTLGAEQYMFVGSSIVKFAGIASPPVVVKDLGNAQPMPWMVEAGGKLFFQTRTAVGADTQIDLWVTDGTAAGTKLVKQIETEFFEFNIFSPISFLGKLYFAHRKSLWSSDGTDAGTNIVSTIPVNSVVGDGAIGTISSIGGRLYFLATSNAAGREPWVSDGTAAGTTMLRDIHAGALGSATASTNPVYFHEFNGQVLFLANDGADAAGLWTTDGTSAGTKLLVKRPMTTIVGIAGSKLLYHDFQTLFSMALQ